MDIAGSIEGTGPGVARRALDLIVAGTALLVLLVPLLIIALAVRASSRGPALFAQTRIGQGGKPFRVLKFRTMRAGAAGSALTVPGDARITPIGRILRATCLDELPQLLNVLAGSMTLVGPRPQTPGFASLYPPPLREVFRYRPGLTGPGVIRFNDDDVLPPGGTTTGDVESFYLAHVVPRRVALDVAFCRRATLRETLRLLWATAVLVPGRLLASPRATPTVAPVLAVAAAIRSASALTPVPVPAPVAAARFARPEGSPVG